MKVIETNMMIEYVYDEMVPVDVQSRVIEVNICR